MTLSTLQYSNVWEPLETIRLKKLLSLVSKEMKAGKTVEVKVLPEKDNPKNARALTFCCYLNDKWLRIGYVVEETLDAVHDAWNKQKIVHVKFEWVKFIIHWSNSSPGWYAGINIAKSGEWPRCVINSASSR